MENQKCKECTSFKFKDNEPWCNWHRIFLEHKDICCVTCLEFRKFKGMNFNEVFELLKQGKLVKLRNWAGYWKWEQSPAGDMSIMMYCKDGKILDIRESERVDYTISNILDDSWEVATGLNCALLRGEIITG
jgi:hypothetical protein